MVDQRVDSLEQMMVDSLASLMVGLKAVWSVVKMVDSMVGG